MSTGMIAGKPESEEEIRAPFDSQVVAVSLSSDGSMLAVGAYAGGMSIESLRYLDARRTQGIWVVNGWDLDRRWPSPVSRRQRRSATAVPQRRDSKRQGPSGRARAS